PQEVHQGLGADLQLLRYFVHSHPSTNLLASVAEGHPENRLAASRTHPGHDSSVRLPERSSATSSSPVLWASFELERATAETGARPAAAPSSSLEKAM